eukprot:468975-Pyramimonas_sp.AAC.1
MVNNLAVVLMSINTRLDQRAGWRNRRSGKAVMREQRRARGQLADSWRRRAACRSWRRRCARPCGGPGGAPVWRSRRAGRCATSPPARTSASASREWCARHDTNKHA